MKKLKLSEYLAPELRHPQHFPTLDTIHEDDEDEQPDQSDDTDESIDPSDADAASSSGENDLDDEDGGSCQNTDKYSDRGIGFTLKKVNIPLIK
jgi:hypothetical protein